MTELGNNTTTPAPVSTTAAPAPAAPVSTTAPKPPSAAGVKSALSAYLTSAVRTLVPYLVGLVVAWAVTLGVPTSMQGSLTAALTFGVGSVYYLAVRWAEAKWPVIGWLLGTPSAPAYKG